MATMIAADMLTLAGWLTAAVLAMAWGLAALIVIIRGRSHRAAAPHLTPELTESRRAEERLRRAVEFSDALIFNSFDGILAIDREYRYTLWNPMMERISGVRHQDAIGRCAFELFPFLTEIGEDRHMSDALAGKTVRSLDRSFRTRNGCSGFFEARYSPIRDESGEIIGALGVITDITARKRAEDELRAGASLQKMILSELDHRVRNNLAGLISLIDLTSRASTSVEHLAGSIKRRVHAMATVHAMLSHQRWRSLDLHGLVRALTPTDEANQVRAHGPPVTIPAQQSTALAMVIQELMANCEKYGPLSTRTGTVEIAWQIVEADAMGARELMLEWRETVGPRGLPGSFRLPPGSPPRPGGGTALILGFVRSELRGEATFDYTPEGASHRIRICLQPREPLDSAGAGWATAAPDG